MELIRVSAAKLKIVLSPEDMRAFGLTADDFETVLPQTRKAFGRILEKAKRETGFETGSAKLYVRVFESTDGGCELFLSKKGAMLPEPEDGAPTYGKVYRTARDEYRADNAYIAVCAELEDMIELCGRLNDIGFSGSSALYYHDGAYKLYLRLPRRFPSFVRTYDGDDGFASVNRYSFLSDYADIVCAAPVMLAAMSEHGEVLAESDAVEKVASGFGRDA